MSNIEDIKRCEELIKPEHANWIGISNQLAIAHVVDRAKEVENDLTTAYLKGYADAEEKHKKRIKELEEERQLVGMPVRNKRDGKIGIVLHQWENGSIAVLENISPRVINTHDSFDTLEIITDEVKHVKTKDDSIPVQKVKEILDRLHISDIEPWSFYKVSGDILFDLKKLLEDK